MSDAVVELFGVRMPFPRSEIQTASTRPSVHGNSQSELRDLGCLTVCMVLPRENVLLRTNSEFRPGGSPVTTCRVAAWAAVFKRGTMSISAKMVESSKAASSFQA